MNFAWLPLTDEWWGFWAVIAGTVALVMGVLWVGKKQQWL